jgi:hypothetical protein
MHPFKDCSPNVKEGVFIGVHLQNRAGAPTLRRIRPLLTLRAQMADPLQVARPYKAVLGRIRIIASGYRLCAGRGVVRSYDPRSTTGDPACLTWMCVQGDLKAVTYGQARRVVDTTFFG